MAELCLITPPIGLNCFVVAGVRDDVSVQEVFRGASPFFVADVITVGVLIAFLALCYGCRAYLQDRRQCLKAMIFYVG